MAIVLWTLTVGAAGATTAGAEVGAGAYPTSQAVAADAQFLEYAPPPAHPGVVCLVDSGVDPNPDTTAALVGAEARDPTWGTGDGLALTQPPIEGHPDGHGTEMAMLMAAPQNGWGMVGVAPTAVRVYSVRVVPAGETTFPFANYAYAINRCLQLGITGNIALSVINLSLAGTTQPAADDLAELENSVDNARHRGMDVVGAVGNDGANAPSYPAAYSSVFAVGAADAAPGTLGTLCPFSSANVVKLTAPGCNSLTGGIDEIFEDDGTAALGFGTSQAAAVTSAVLAALRAYAPNLADWQAEACLTETEQAGGNIDVAAAFSECGLGRIVQAGLAAVPAPPDSRSQVGGGSGVDPSPPHGPTWVVVPRVARPSLRRGKLTVTVLNRPKGTFVEVGVMVRRGHRLVVVEREKAAAARVIIAIGSAAAVEVRFITPEGGLSAWATRSIR